MDSAYWDPMRAMIWQGKEPKDLNTFVHSSSPFVQLLSAFSINEAGEIACQGVTRGGEIHACLAIPNGGAAPTSSAESDIRDASGPAAESVRSFVQRRFRVFRR